jgi:hypothetical protein
MDNLLPKKKKKKRVAKAKEASQAMSHRPVAVSIVHVNTTQAPGNPADQDLVRLLHAGDF